MEGEMASGPADFAVLGRDARQSHAVAACVNALSGMSALPLEALAASPLWRAADLHRWISSSTLNQTVLGTGLPCHGLQPRRLAARAHASFNESRRQPTCIPLRRFDAGGMGSCGHPESDICCLLESSSSAGV
ncbi:MAG: hypothetical protein ACPIOQ_11865 [Promethearchaeia archaeon]